MPRSAELDVMLAPAVAWRRLAKTPSTGNWLAGPFFVALVLGCAVSVMTSGRLTLRLVLPGMVCAGFVPILEMASLAVVCRGLLPFRRAVDLFFAGHAPWSLWTIGSALVWGLFPAPAVYPHAVLWRATAILVIAWSGYVDFCFFREVAGVAAIRRLVVQRTICWVPGLLLFVAPAGWQAVASRLGI